MLGGQTLEQGEIPQSRCVGNENKSAWERKMRLCPRAHWSSQKPSSSGDPYLQLMVRPLLSPESNLYCLSTGKLKKKKKTTHICVPSEKRIMSLEEYKNKCPPEGNIPGTQVFRGMSKTSGNLR